MSKDVQPSDGRDTTGPLPPGPPGPLPPVELKTVWDLAKIVLFVVVWYISVDANRALQAAVDYTRVAQTAIPMDWPIFGNSILPQVTWEGAKIGLLQGLIVAVQALVTVWAGPTLFTYLGPVLTSAFMVPIKLVAEFRRAWKGAATDGSKDSTDDKKKDGEKKE